MRNDKIYPYRNDSISQPENGFTRRTFVSSLSLTFCLAACGGGETSSPLVLLPGSSTPPSPTPSATGTTIASDASYGLGLTPTPKWTGVPGSGFGGSIPTDPQRITAKPVLRPLQPPNLWYTESLTIGVWAAAKGDSTSSDSLGIAKVILHFEGSTLEITKPTVRIFNDTNGKERKYWGWWATIGRPANVTGHGHVYWEAIPLDSSMQSRVIGPFQYSPQSSPYDAELVVAASSSTVAGKSYQTIVAALDWCATKKVHNPLITIVEAGIYDLGRINGLYQGEGYAHITATAPVTIRASSGGLGYWRPGYTGIRFMSEKITIDFINSGEFYAENSSTYKRGTWFDGCILTNTGGRYSLVNKAPRNLLATLVRGRPYFTEAVISNLWNAACVSSLVRGCIFKRCWGDLTGNSDVVIGNRVDEYDSAEYREEIPALKVGYTGPEATASLSMDGFNNMARTLTAKAGNIVHTFGIETSTSAVTAGTNYTVQNVVNWLNTLPGWSATLLDDTRRAACIQKQKSVGAWAEENLKNNGVTLYTMIDVHADFFQSWAFENAVVADNILTNCSCQNIFLKDGFARDVFVVNNSFNNLPDIPMASQLASVHSHVVIIHNSSSVQSWGFRADLTGAPGSTAEKYQPDIYCLFSHNVAPRISWGGTPVGNMIQYNHIFSGSAVPANSMGTTVGGSATDLFANHNIGEFSPRGALLSNQRSPLARVDQAQKPRLTVDALGARSEM